MTATLAIAIAGMVGADASLAATLVAVTGLIVANFGRAILDALDVRGAVSRGLAMGVSGHGLGTAATADEPDAFPFAAIAMALNAELNASHTFSHLLTPPHTFSHLLTPSHAFSYLLKALNAALSTVLVSIPAVRRALLAVAGVPAA